MASLTNFLFQGSPVPAQPTGSDSSTSFPLWQQQYAYNLSNAATNLADTPYTPFPGPTVATPSSQTTQAEKMATQNVGDYMPYQKQAGALTAASAQPITGAQINQYMNPYENQVIGGIESNLNTNLQQNVLPGVQNSFVSAGQSKSPQEMQATNNALYQNQQAIGQQVGSALETGYQGALSAAQNQQGREATAGAQLGTLGALQQQEGLTDVGQLAAAGQTIDANQQANLNAAQNQFYQQEQYPYQQLGYASNILRGLPTGSTTQTVSQPSSQLFNPSPLASIAGTAGVASALGVKRGGHIRKGALSMTRAA